MTTLAFWTPGPMEIVIILVIGLLLFGRRLPEVGRSLGRSIVEFKKGVKGIEDEVEQASTEPRKLDANKAESASVESAEPAESRTIPQENSGPATSG